MGSKNCFKEQTCFLLVANTFLDALSTGDDPKKSSADVTFGCVSLGFTGLNKKKTIFQ